MSYSISFASYERETHYITTRQHRRILRGVRLCWMPAEPARNCSSRGRTAREKQSWCFSITNLCGRTDRQLKFVWHNWKPIQCGVQLKFLKKFGVQLKFLLTKCGGQLKFLLKKCGVQLKCQLKNVAYNWNANWKMWRTTAIPIQKCGVQLKCQ